MKRIAIIIASTVMAATAVLVTATPAEARRDTTWPTVVVTK